MMSSMGVGIAQAAMEDSIAYAASRKQFGTEINFQAIQFMLAEMSMDISAARLLIQHAAQLLDAGYPIAKRRRTRNSSRQIWPSSTSPARMVTLANIVLNGSIVTCAFRRSMKAPTKFSV